MTSNQSSAVFQHTLATAYAEQAAHYEHALELAANLPLSSGVEHPPEAQLQKIRDVLDEVALIEARIGETKEAWKTTQAEPGPELKNVLARVAELIDRIMTHVSAAEQDALKQQQRLLPELDAAARGLRMQRAYGALSITAGGS